MLCIYTVSACLFDVIFGVTFLMWDGEAKQSCGTREMLKILPSSPFVHLFRLKLISFIVNGG
jgi:hypothetical protein